MAELYGPKKVFGRTRWSGPPPFGSGGPPKYFGAHGTLEDHVPGLYIVEATNSVGANRKLNRSLHQLGAGYYLKENLQEITDEWAEVLKDTIDQVRNREKEYYTDLGSEVFYVEI